GDVERFESASSLACCQSSGIDGARIAVDDPCRCLHGNGHFKARLVERDEVWLFLFRLARAGTRDGRPRNYVVEPEIAPGVSFRGDTTFSTSTPAAFLVVALVSKSGSRGAGKRDRAGGFGALVQELPGEHAGHKSNCPAKQIRQSR